MDYFETSRIKAHLKVLGPVIGRSILMNLSRQGVPMYQINELHQYMMECDAER